MTEQQQQEFDRGVTVSFKTHGGYDASLIVLRGEDLADIQTKLNDFSEDLVNDIIATEVAVHTAYRLNAPQDEQPAAQQDAAPAGGGRTCEHGKRVYKSGSSAKGPWAGWFCALPKGSAGACKPEWED